MSAMAHIEIKQRKGRDYAYYVKRDSDGRRHYRYIGPISNTNPKGVACPRCGKTLRERTVRRLIANQLRETKDRMIENKEHLSDYPKFAILEELIDAF